MTDGIDGLYKKPPRHGEFTFRSFTIEPMSADQELHDLLREFEQTGLPNIFHPPPEPAAREETLPAPTPPMKTRSARKQFKPEVCSKRNEDRHKQSGQTSEDPRMNPPGSVEIQSEGEENIAPRRPPYVPPL